MSNVFEDIEKARKKIFEVTVEMPNFMDATLEVFSKMGIDAKKDGECLSGNFYRVKLEEI